jgi:hypothetical protein
VAAVAAAAAPATDDLSRRRVRPARARIRWTSSGSKAFVANVESQAADEAS